MTDPPIIVASNRGPVAFVREPDGSITMRRGVGGLVTAVGGAVRGRDATWIASAITDADRAQVAAGKGIFDIDLHPGARDPGTVHVHLADIDEATYNLSYNEFSNRILWFLHHDLWEVPRAPSFGAGDAEAFAAYRSVNETFADLLADRAPESAFALPQDYHLSLVPKLVRARRDDLPQSHFWHIPFCSPDNFRVLPDNWGIALLEGLLGADVVGFHTERWARNFIDCCREVLGAKVRGRVVHHDGRASRVASYPIGVNVEHLDDEAGRPEVATAFGELTHLIGDRIMILRVDRTELSKNILRGLIAFEMLLERRADLHGRVVHVAMLTPSRRGVPEYEEYIQACKARAAAINDRFARPDWQPLILEIEDDFPRTLAAYRRYDVLVVNPVYDGMNLVAREGPCLNERDGVLVLSRNAGAAAELAGAALIVNPFDVAATAAAIERAIDMPAAERRGMAAALVPRARGTSPERWLRAQLSDLRRRRAV